VFILISRKGRYIYKKSLYRLQDELVRSDNNHYWDLKAYNTPLEILKAFCLIACNPVMIVIDKCKDAIRKWRYLPPTYRTYMENRFRRSSVNRRLELP
jgi:hypothetical protein